MIRKRMHLATSGHVAATDVGAGWELTPAMLAEMAQNFDPTSPTVIDIAHVGETGTYSSTGFLGRVLGVTSEPAEGLADEKELWGLVELEDAALTRIAAGEWKHASCAIMLDVVDNIGGPIGTVLISVGMTNHGVSVAGQLSRMCDP